jgi:hypothetical protein
MDSHWYSLPREPMTSNRGTPSGVPRILFRDAGRELQCLVQLAYADCDVANDNYAIAEPATAFK